MFPGCCRRDADMIPDAANRGTEPLARTLPPNGSNTLTFYTSCRQLARQINHIVCK